MEAISNPTSCWDSWICRTWVILAKVKRAGYGAQIYPQTRYRPQTDAIKEYRSRVPAKMMA